MSERYVNYVELRRSGKSPSQIAREMDVSTSMTGRWDRRFSQEYPQEYAATQSNHSRAMRRIGDEKRKKRESKEIANLMDKISFLEKKVESHEMKACEPLPETMTPLEKGRAGELLVEYHLLRRGYEVHVPTRVIGGTDLFLVSKKIASFDLKSSPPTLTMERFLSSALS